MKDRPSAGIRADPCWRVALLLVALFTVVIRARYFGDPFIDVDEEYYLLAGDRLLAGHAVPYIDIWDRKPPGLFLLYAAIRLLGGDGIVQYQCVAACFAAATAVLIARLARRVAPSWAALAAALAYAPALAMNGGQGGQTPVFYNLFMVGAASLLARLAAGVGPRSIVANGFAAMLLVGLAMQLKYTVAFEGVYFGIASIIFGRRAGLRPVALAAVSLGWAATAAAPTLAAWAAYTVAGHGQAFVYANFLSILSRGPVGPTGAAQDLLRILLRLSPFLLTIGLGATWLRRSAGPTGDPGARHVRRFLVGWLGVATGAFLLFGGYFDHYALPLLPPLLLLCAPVYAVDRHRAGPVLAALTLAALFVAYPLDAARRERRHGDAGYAARLAGAIAPRLHGRCLYVFDGEPILYLLTHSCLPTRWPFPAHLSLLREKSALGVDPRVETGRILASRPPVIATRANADPEINPETKAMVDATLARDYRLIFERRDAGARDVDQLWALR